MLSGTLTWDGKSRRQRWQEINTALAQSLHRLQLPLASPEVEYRISQRLLATTGNIEGYAATCAVS